MTLDEMFKQYVHNAVEEYLKANLDIILRERNVQPNSLAQEDINEIISQYLSDNDYMTRDDVVETINATEVRIDSAYLSA